MKYTKKLLVCSLILAMTSCSTTERFTVYAPQGTKIYTPDNDYTPKGIVSPDGKIGVEIPSDMYCGYILAQTAESGVKIPIGLDYKINHHAGTKAAIYVGAPLTAIGTAATVIGLLVAAISSKDENTSGTFGKVALGGLAVGGIGAAIGAPAHARLGQTAYDYNFGYISQQRIEMPALSYTLLNPNKPKTQLIDNAEKTNIGRKKHLQGEMSLLKTL